LILSLETLVQTKTYVFETMNFLQSSKLNNCNKIYLWNKWNHV